MGYTTILLYYYTTILLYYYTTILLYYHTTILLYYYTTILLYYYTTILLYYYTIILLYYYTTILLYYYHHYYHHPNSFSLPFHSLYYTLLSPLQPTNKQQINQLSHSLKSIFRVFNSRAPSNFA